VVLLSGANRGSVGPTAKQQGESDAADRVSNEMISYTIDDPITDPLMQSVEVTIYLGGRKRWLFFTTPQLLASVGDWVEGAQVRMHLGERHMIVVSAMSEAIIEKVLQQLHADGELESRTLPVEE
jgi:hypothetical protein